MKWTVIITGGVTSKPASGISVPGTNVGTNEMLGWSTVKAGRLAPAAAIPVVLLLVVIAQRLLTVGKV